MISRSRAFSIVTEAFKPTEPSWTDLSLASGAVLAEDVRCSIDMPPFDRSAMDGYAIAGEGDDLELCDEIAAGSVGAPLASGQAAPIMTGAPVPEGADRVVMVERTRREGGRVRIEAVPSAGANICRRGEDISAGDLVIAAGSILTPNRIGIAAMAGRQSLRVRPRLAVGLLTTGNEVIPPPSVPGPGQVRNANLPMMRALLDGAWADVKTVLHAADDPESLRSSLSQLISSCDVVVAAGGVSMGTRDYVPGVLKELGVVLAFDRVAQKPGKPLTFGTAPDGTRVFGMPGNPVSVLVSVEEYLLPALRRAAGHASFEKRDLRGRACFSHRAKPGRDELLRVRAVYDDSEWSLELPDSSGSGDLMSTASTNALAVLEADRLNVEPGCDLLFHLYSFAAGEAAFR